MNVEKHLILVKGEDRTEAISHCKYENGKWQVRFIGNDKIYPYSYLNVEWLKDPVSLFPETTVVYHNNQPLSGVSKILVFKDHIRLFFVSGYKKVYSRHELKLEQSCLQNQDVKNCFTYLKQLASIIRVTNEADDNFLSNQYEKISYISESSVLANYLCPNPLIHPKNKRIAIFPFGFNLSQKPATEKALSEQISVIEGPPGTGKTQTILNIIANAVIDGKTVAVVSNNNSATANVLEKLEKSGVGFIAAYLGNMENKARFFAEQTGTYPEMSSWSMNSKTYDAQTKELETSYNELNDMLKAKNRAAELKQELSALKTEQEYFKTYYTESNESITPYRALYRHNSAKIMALWFDYQQITHADKMLTLKHKMRYLLNYGIVSFSFFDNSPDKVIALFQKLYYEQRNKELNDQIQKLTKRLKSYHFERAMEKYSEGSMKLLRAELAKKYANKAGRPQFSKESLWRDFGSFIQEYPVILSTTHSLRNCASANYLYDYVIMDEASQVDIVTGALALSCAKKAIIVGDVKQLPNVVTDNTREETNLIYERFKLDKAYHYAENSMLSSITNLYQDVPRTLLREHYRCHPKIIGFCNQKFYNNELIVLTNENEQDVPLIAYKTAKGNHARGNFNQRQIDVILEEILPQFDDTKQSIGIISPYRLQTDKLKYALANRNIEVDTVHKYQGREKDIIILTTVVNEINEFVNNPNLINVAVSRAVDKLVVVISDNDKNDNSNIGDLIKYIQYNNFDIINVYAELKGPRADGIACPTVVR